MPTEANPKPRPGVRVGILFVHGIGQQEPGDTLIDFGQPLFKWVRDWVGRNDVPFSARLLGSALKEPVLQPGSPAHLEFEVTPTDKAPESKRASTWTLAESCWASEFRDPPFGELALWMVGVGAWMILSHFGKYIRLRLSRGWRLFLGVPLVVLAVVLALLVQVLVAVLALIAALPIPRLRRGLAGLLRVLTGTLGDSYVLISSPVQEAAAVARVRHDLEWLAKRCDDVFVVAHSQGSAIAHQALKSDRPAKVRRLLTFGSGLGKLEELRLLAARGQETHYLQAQVGLPLAALALALLPRAVTAVIEASLPTFWNLWILLIFLSPLVILGAILKNTWQGWRAYLAHLKNDLRLPGVDWHDCWASADPVPNGPIGGTAVEGLTVESVQIRNRASAIADHSGYWTNRDEFVTWVMSRVDEVAATGLVAPAAFDEARRSRAIRVRTLLAMRWISLASLVIAVYGLSDQLAAFAGSYIWTPLTELPQLSWAGAVAQALAAAVGALVGLITGIPEETLGAVGLMLVSLLLLSAATLVLYLLTLAVWKWWDQIRMNAFFGADQPLVVMLAPPISTLLVGLTPATFAIAALRTGDPMASLALVGVALGWYLKIVAALALIGLLVIFSIPALYLGTITLFAALVVLIEKVASIGKWLRSRGPNRP